jgi:hypothetical protein
MTSVLAVKISTEHLLSEELWVLLEEGIFWICWMEWYKGYMRFAVLSNLNALWNVWFTVKIFIWLWLYGSCGIFPSFQFLNLYTVGRTPLTGDQPDARSLPTHRTTPTQNKRTQTSMPSVGFEPTIPVFERVKTFHALDRAGTVIVR